jgi:O-antigen/teichoic acid export membrane protein
MEFRMTASSLPRSGGSRKQVPQVPHVRSDSHAGAAGGDSQLAAVARGGALNMAGAAVAALTTVGVTVMVTREFSKPVAGGFFTAISLFLIVEAVASLGAYVGAVNFIARLRSLGYESKIPQILRASFIPVAVASVTAATALALLATPLAHALTDVHFGHSGARTSTVTQALRGLAIMLPFAAMLDTCLGASRGFRDMRPTVIVDRLGRSTAQLLGVLVAVLTGSAGLLAPLWALPYLPAAAAAALWLRRIRRQSSKGMTPSPGRHRARAPAARRASADVRRGEPPEQRAGKMSDASARAFWRFTLPRGLATLAQVTIQRMDIVLVAILRGPADAAIYTAATRFLVAGQLGNAAISMAAQPRFAELFAIRNWRAANDIYRSTTAWLILMTWPLYLLAIIYGPELLTVFGHSYRTGDDVMVILGLAMLLATACGQVDMVLVTSGRSSWSLCNGLAAVILNVGLDLLLIPRYGITGAAIGWAVAITVTNLAPLAQLAITVKLHPFGSATFAACALSLTCFGAIPLIVRAVAGDSTGASGAALAAGCLLLAAGLWLLRDTFQLPLLPGLSFLRKYPGAKRAATQMRQGATVAPPDGQ